MRFFAKTSGTAYHGETRDSDEFAVFNDALVPGALGGVFGAAVGIWLAPMDHQPLAAIAAKIYIAPLMTIGAGIATYASLFSINSGEVFKNKAKSLGAGALAGALLTFNSCSADAAEIPTDANLFENAEIVGVIEKPEQRL